MQNFAATVMTIDISTMSLMVSVASILQSITLIFLVFLANQYRGISIYAIGTILSALGFLIFPMRLLLSDKLLLLNLRFFGNLFITCAQIMYTIGIGKFIGKKINYLFLIALSSAFCVTQFYFIYIKDDYLLRNSSIILPAIISNLLAIYYLMSNQDKSLFSSSVFTSIIFLFYVICLMLRIVMIPLTQTTSLMQSNSINIITLWAIFLFDYLRNSGFIMMVNQRMYQDLHTLATTDSLTKALNRRAIENYLQHEVTRFKRSEIPFSLILIDVDKFKLINDNYGHTFGDVVLQHLVNILKKSLRSQDLVSRWGGEEFLILLPNTNIETASLIANRLRIIVEENPAAEGMIYYTISLGVATFAETYTNSLSSFFIALDQALYQAKNNGRNQVVIAATVQ
ncbi:GGDEF domain-containing protein [Anabaena sp. PCC 7938]|uniref:GGDEF domain-containing protein n=1 Tax=Anabaena TaxID=1163 RepID=UPI000B61B817|nr:MULTISPECIES: GGDEF domain-containing protein [Anabaena]MCM2408813.1 GGDEF domain-containing protein [Anabaena sp. CCAP 1446/1C]BAY02344.1 diguanylate cyclase [Anabaena cylindrica PCC 7122]